MNEHIKDQSSLWDVSFESFCRIYLVDVFCIWDFTALEIMSKMALYLTLQIYHGVIFAMYLGNIVTF